ncbi:hypothetical protein OIU84_010608 [Salix udensis]|uniref:Uncharacterized protein n=1 Tax=Salix udensis TaxID=889485 RepID=A0AAD6JLU0_9ROSI|nr:hypothetical protein OIU84_010608 [Salix udensis]
MEIQHRKGNSREICTSSQSREEVGDDESSVHVDFQASTRDEDTTWSPPVVEYPNLSLQPVELPGGAENVEQLHPLDHPKRLQRHFKHKGQARGDPHWHVHMDDFPTSIGRAELIQIPSAGLHFTWHNGQKEEDTILRKLDWAFGNQNLL